MFLIGGMAVLLGATTAWARETMLDLAVADALASPAAALRSDVAIYMAGQKHPKVARRIGEWKANRRTNALNKSDADACAIAYLSAVASLQERAKKEGGNAVIEIRSVTRNDELSSPTKYRCAAGNVVANVALKGTVVQLAGR
jgi:uncharacterized protein YbjQ (UPF0145 family)